MPFRTFSDMNKPQPSSLHEFTEEESQALDLVSAPAPEGGLFSRPRPFSETIASKKHHMTLQDTHYSTSSGSTNELYLLEQAHVIGRKTELRQLLKLINLSRQGQPKAVLVSGDSGIGKTALMDSFSDLVRQAVYTRIVDCRQERFRTPQHFYVTVIDSLRLDAEQMIDEALAAINEGLAEVGLVWEAQDLIRAVSLVQMQEALDTKDGKETKGDGKLGNAKYETITPATSDKQRAMTEEQLMKAIKNSVPTVKKLRLSLTGQVEKIVKLILNPWVIAACHLVNPVDAKLKTAFALSDDIKIQERLFDANYTKDWEAKRPQYFQMDDDAPESPETIVLSKNSNFTTVTPPKNNAKPKSSLQGPMGDMTAGLLYVLNFVNRTISTIDSSLLLMFDNWETISGLPYRQRDELKQLVSDVIEECSAQADFRLMLLFGCDSDQQSKSLGGPLFAQFRTKLLLSPLEEPQARKFCKQTLQEAGLDLDERVHQHIMQLTQGNPYWHFRIVMYILERAKANRIPAIEADFFHQLCIEAAEDVLDLAFTRVKLACLEKEEALEKVIAALLVSFPFHPFRVGDAAREISLSQQIPEAFVLEIIERLTHHQFLMPLMNQPALPGKAKTKGKPSFENVWLVLQNKIDREFLRGKTTHVQADLPTDEKLNFLKKVIPLSIQAGELDRAKTQEVLSLCYSLGNTDIVEYLEDLFIKSLSAEQPSIRVTAINNLALIDSEKSRQSLFSAMHDNDAMVREYAAKNLNAISQSTTDPEFHRILVDVLQDSLDDEYEAVRAQAYQTLSKYRWSHDLTMVFIKGLSDIDPTVRLSSVKFLAELEQESPFIQNSLMDALDDPEPEVRKYACFGVQRYSGPEIIHALITRLSDDTEPGIRALAADSLSAMDDESAFRALSLALMNPNESEDVKLAVVRTLGKHHSPVCENILLDALEGPVQDDPTLTPENRMPPALLWATIRSLGQIASSRQVMDKLDSLQYQAENVIIQSAAKLALKKIHRRLDEFPMPDKHAESQQSNNRPFPTEYEQEIIIPEDDRIDLSS